MQDDGFDGRVVAKFLQLADHRLRRENDAIQVDHADAVAKAAKSGFIAPRMQRQVNQRKHSQHKEEECSSANQNPEQVRERRSAMKKV